MTTRVVFPNGERARLTSQGQITVPKAIRDAIGIRPGDEVEFVPRGRDLVIKVRPRRSVLDFAGMASDSVAGIPLTAAEMDALIDRAMSDAAVASEMKVRRASVRRTAGRS